MDEVWRCSNRRETRMRWLEQGCRNMKNKESVMLECECRIERRRNRIEI